VKRLKAEIKMVEEKYMKIQVEDRKHRGSLSKKIYEIKSSLYDTRCMLKRIKPIRKQLENMYKQNLILRTKIRKMNEKMNERRKQMETRGLDLLAQVALS